MVEALVEDEVVIGEDELVTVVGVELVVDVELVVGGVVVDVEVVSKLV